MESGVSGGRRERFKSLLSPAVSDLRQADWDRSFGFFSMGLFSLRAKPETDYGTGVLKVRLFTGKTHQIRAHLAYLGSPIVGDGKYGDNAFNRSHGAKELQLASSELTLRFNKDDFLYYLNGKTFTRGKGV